MKPSDLALTLEKCFKEHKPVLIKGAPGIGKSDIVEQACNAVGANLIIEHPVVSDPTDYKGLPYASDGKADFLPFGSLQKMIDAESLTVVFLDDLGQAPPSVQAACMQLLLARRINGHKVSDHICFVAATNRRVDRAGVTGMLEPVKSRFITIVNLDVDLDEWVKWALVNNMPTYLIALMRFKPELLHDFQPSNDLVNSPCPRTIANMGALDNMSFPEHLELELFSGAAGEGLAAEYVGFKRIAANMVNPDMVILNPDQVDVPTDPAVLYALCGALSSKASDQNIDRLVTFYNRLPADFSVLAMKDTAGRDPKLMNTRAYIQWASEHADILV